MKSITTVAGLALFLGTSFTAAQPAGGGMGGMGMGGAPMSFASLDTDSNGELTAEELGSMPPVQAGRLSAADLLGNWDSDGNGSISEEEFNNRPRRGGG